MTAEDPELDAIRERDRLWALYARRGAGRPHTAHDRHVLLERLDALQTRLDLLEDESELECASSSTWRSTWTPSKT